MRKSYIALTVLAMAALVSCQENEINYNTLEKGEVGFYLRGAKATKADEASVTTNGLILELGSDNNGHTFFLEQTVTDLDAIAPETKGTPAYTENILDLYNKKFNATVTKKDNTVVESNGEFVYDDGKYKFVRKYNTGLWDNAPLYFYMWMPGALNSAVGVSGLSFDKGTIKFDYDGTKLTTAAAMQDLLFSARYFTGLGTGKDEYDEKEGAEALFHHALTGVKFASSNTEEEDETIKITEVIINGIKDSGHCEITPAPEDGKYSDDPENYSSASVTAWSSLSVSKNSSYSSGTYGAPIDYESGDFGDTFYSGGNTRNLNDEDATQTFWIIPQEISDDVTVTIKYEVNGETGEWDLEFGKILSKTAGSHVTFKAGELYTFYVRLDDVNVKIEDEVNATTKSNVVISNTGTVDAYIRASIIGQWLDDDENPVFGFVDNITSYEEVDSWYDDQFGNGSDDTETKHHGTFVGLPGYKGGANPTSEGGWVLCKDGFYYYQTAVAPGQPTGSALFTSYTVNDAFPKFVQIGSNKYPIHFLLEISTQAVSAKKQDTGDYTWQEAWARALGYTPVKK